MSLNSQSSQREIKTKYRKLCKIHFSSADDADNADFSSLLYRKVIIYLRNPRNLRMKNKRGIFDTTLFHYIIKYSAFRLAMYKPQTEACGYIAPFSVRRMFIEDKPMSSSIKNIVF